MSGAAERPTPFGYKTAWVAVRSADVHAVADAIGLKQRIPVSWTRGLERAYETDYFVAPPVKGWVLVVGSRLGEMSDRDDKPWQMIVPLSSKFGEAQYFCTHRVVELHIWAKASAGRLVRAYGYLGEDGETLFQEGRPTPEELELGFDSFSISAEPGAEASEDAPSPDEESVMSIARKWSVAPVDFGPGSGEPALGLVGTLEQ